MAISSSSTYHTDPPFAPAFFAPGCCSWTAKRKYDRLFLTRPNRGFPLQETACTSATSSPGTPDYFRRCSRFLGVSYQSAGLSYSYPSIKDAYCGYCCNYSSIESNSTTESDIYTSTITHGSICLSICSWIP